MYTSGHDYEKLLSGCQWVDQLIECVWSPGNAYFLIKVELVLFEAPIKFPLKLSSDG